MPEVRQKLNASIRINVSLKRSVLRDLNRMAGARKRSQFLAHLVEEEAKRVQRFEAFERGFGAWAGHRHPELKDGAVAYQRRLRQEGERRWHKQFKKRG